MAAPRGELAALGFPVPPAVCVTTEAFRLALAPFRAGIDGALRDVRLADPAEATRAAAATAELLAALRVPDEVVSRLARALPELAAGGAALAVRSSATSEDGGETSFAGQYASVLGVRGEAAVLAAVLAVWRSFFSANALAARAGAGRDGADEAMGVLVQRMVDAECAGVAFSVDPVQPDGDVVVIDAAWGLGVGAVDGSVATDTLRVRRDFGGAEDPSIVEKREQIVADPAGGVRRAAVAEDRQRAACLPQGRRRAVAELVLAAEWALGTPQDVEWAISQERETDRLWLLQSRPITGLPAGLRRIAPFPVAWRDQAERLAFRRIDWSSVRRVPGPLEHDVIASVDRTTQLTALWEGYREVTTYGVFNGRGYFAPAPTGALGGHRRVAENAAADLGERLREAGATPWQHVAPEVVAATERLRAFDREAADGAALADHVEDALAAHHRHWTLHWTFWGPTKTALAPYREAVERLSGLRGDAAKELGDRLLEGEETVLTRQIDELHELALIARAASAVGELLREMPEDVLGRLAAMPEAGAFRERLAAFLDAWGEHVGHGYGSEASLETPTWREEPRTVLRLIAGYLDPAVGPPSVRRERARKVRDAEVDRLCAGTWAGRRGEPGGTDPPSGGADLETAVVHAEAAAALRRWLPYARRIATDLEEHNHYIDQLTVGQLRHALGAAARWLVAEGALCNPEDLFWLQLGEVLAALRAEPPPSLADRIAERRRQHAAWATLTPPPVMGVPTGELEPRREYKDELTTPAPPGATLLTGQAASAGRHRGRARVVAATDPLPAVAPGDVLVAENAGPLWTPLFPLLGALVLDQGVLTQHAATTAREYGVPAVIRTTTATRRIPDRAWLVVDGDAGTVEIEAGPA
jgi:pyruvate,water dikinase